MNELFEFVIGRMLWLWLPLYTLYRLIKDIVEVDFNIDNE